MQRVGASSTTDAGVSSAGFVDVSVPIRSNMVHWPGNPAVELVQTESMARGDACTVSRLSLGVHTGTHVDAPAHFIPGGAGVDGLALDALVGPARVIQIRDPRAASAEELALHDLARGERVLLKTANSPRCWTSPDFVRDYVALSVSGARLLVARGVKTVGIDYLSIASVDSGAEVHRILLGAGICVVEGLNLTHAPAGRCELFCFPLLLSGADGAPARVMLRYPPAGSARR